MTIELLSLLPVKSKTLDLSLKAEINCQILRNTQ